MQEPTFSTFKIHYAERLAIAGFLYAVILGIGSILRVLLYFKFHDGPWMPRHLALVLPTGLLFDTLVTTVGLSPLLLLLAFFPLRFLAIRPLRFLLLSSACAGLLFLAAMEYYFFEEFDARFNHIALDYLLYPHEVFINIWDSYNVPLFTCLAAAGGAFLSLPGMLLTRGARFGKLPWAARWRASLAVLIAGAVAVAGLFFLPAQVSDNRVTSEIAQNGLNQLVRAWLTAHLDYKLYYPTLPEKEAWERAARVFRFDPLPLQQAATGGAIATPDRALTPLWSGKGRPWDVVILLEESLGSEFIGVLHNEKLKTSREFDRWRAEGTLFTNLVATGNRTVRGLESTLCSFIPLPGDSIVKRDRSENVASLARVLRQEGYRTAFFYGGYGLFDNMKAFMRANGYQDFIEEPDFPKDAFRTIWGVADEYIFDALLARQIEAAARKERFFATLMSVSNHKPYSVPERLRRHPGKLRREGALEYADWALGRYLDQARADGILAHTLVLIVGDHGARVYGSEKIPAESYRIPALLLAPDTAFRGKTVERLCSQVDLAPTILSVNGIACRAPFLGEDVSNLPAEGGRAFLQHNRDLGLLTDDTLVTLGLMKTITFYRRSGRASDVFERVPEGAVTAEMRETSRNATAAFQIASELYENRRYRIPEEDSRPRSQHGDRANTAGSARQINETH